MTHNRIGDVMVVFSPRVESGQTKDYKIGICCFSARHARLKRITDWLEIRIMCSSRATCLLPDCCFSEIAL
jgi:hypothetical protein